MKIVQQTDRLLVLQDRPWSNGFMLHGLIVGCIVAMVLLADRSVTAGGRLGGLIAAGLPFLIGLLLLRHDRLIFDRERRQLTREVRSIRGKSKTVYPLDRVAEARVDANSDGEGTMFQMELRLIDPAEIIAFTNSRTFGKRPRVLAQAVNDWLGKGA